MCGRARSSSVVSRVPCTQAEGMEEGRWYGERGGCLARRQRHVKARVALAWSLAAEAYMGGALRRTWVVLVLQRVRGLL